MARRKITEQQIKLIPKLRRLGRSYRDIAKLVGISDCSAWKYSSEKKLLRYRIHMRNYYRINYVGTYIDGKYVSIRTKGKRPHASKCEICEKANMKLVYYHWNNDSPHWGIWMCNGCHGIVVRYKHNPSWSFSLETLRKITKYNNLKAQVESTWEGIKDPWLEHFLRMFSYKWWETEED